LNAIVMKALRAGAFIVVEGLLDDITVLNQSTTEPSFFASSGRRSLMRQKTRGMGL